ncbi:MAG: 30S ribosomal protein S18 [Patescibacteria group bacterium]
MPRRMIFHKRQCYFCRKKIDEIDFKEAALLGKFLSPWAKIKPSRNTGTCAKHERRLSEAIKRARFMSLLPYVKR